MLTVGSLFSGVGGLDKGLEMAGLRVVWQIESDKQCRSVLARHWPDVVRYEDVTEYMNYDLGTVDVICGGDPCPIRSRARTMPTKYPDLSGWFLAVVGRCGPRWVVRENVPAPDDVDFDTALGMLGYGTAIVRLDASEVTGQNRQRDFIVGRREASRQIIRDIFRDCEGGTGALTAGIASRQLIACLTTKRQRYDSRDNYVWDGRLRILDAEERERFSGFPVGWTDGFFTTARARMMGNAVVPQVAEWIGRRIMDSQGELTCQKDSTT